MENHENEIKTDDAGAAPQNEGIPGTVYILCFSEPFKTALHYIGWTKDLKRRLAHHRRGTGAKFMRAVCVEAKLDFVVSRTFEGKCKNFERRLKKAKNTAEFCPRCRAKRGLLPRNPQGWTEPRRKYKLTRGADGCVVVENPRFIPEQMVLPRVAKRVKIGTRVLLDGKFFVRQTTRGGKPAFREDGEQIKPETVKIQFTFSADDDVGFVNELQTGWIGTPALHSKAIPQRTAPDGYDKRLADEFEDIPF